MLNSLYIKNVALIDCAEAEFSGGLNVISGETGSGKSVLMEALNFVLGAKADKTLIKSGESECLVRAVFDVKDTPAVSAVFEEYDMDFDNELVVSRKMSVDGKNSLKINGASSTVSVLKKITSALIDFHGQSEHFALLKKENCLKIIDGFGNEGVLDLKAEISSLVLQYKTVSSEIEKLGGDEDSRKNRLDVLNYQIEEIIKAELKDGEEEELLDARQKLIHREKILSALSAVKDATVGEGGSFDILSNTEKFCSQIGSLGDEYSSLCDRISSVVAEVDDIGETVDGLLSGLDDFSFNADDVEERLDLIKKLKKKYGGSVEEIYDFLNKAQEEKDNLENFEEKSATLVKKKNTLECEIFVLYEKLSQIRRNIAGIFEKDVISELNDLAMGKAKFCVCFAETPEKEKCNYNSNNGFDDVEFMFSANAGEPLKPLSAVISGGEISRFMIAVKAITAGISETETFIFDEIDSGISGMTAEIVAEKFAKISLGAQVIAISHLPQISAMADNNLLIYKEEIDGKTRTAVKNLTNDEKLYEVVRLVGGKNDSESAINHAKNLIENANCFKKKIKTNRGE